MSSGKRTVADVLPVSLLAGVFSCLVGSATQVSITSHVAVRTHPLSPKLAACLLMLLRAADAVL